MTIYYKGTAGNDRLKVDGRFPYREIVRMEGFGGNDELNGAFLHDNEIFGGAGNDTLRGGAGLNDIFGGDGNDYIDALGGYSRVYGESGNDWIFGGNRGNLLDGGSGSDTLEGGDGGDIYVVDRLSDVIIEAYVPYFDNDPNPRDTVHARVSWSLGANLEDLTLNGSAAINGTGNGLSNVIVGNTGANMLQGLAGADTIEGGLGNDTIDGGAGVDTARYLGTNPVTVSLARPGPQVTGQGTDILTSIENLVSGAGSDLLVGNALANRLSAGDGNDTLRGWGGADTMSGGRGDDIYSTDGRAIIIEGYAAGTDSVYSSKTYALAANVENLVLTGTTAINGTGNALANWVGGNSGANILTGGAGNDTIAASAGADTLIGGDGRDILRGGADDAARDVFLFRSAVESRAGTARDVIFDFQSGVDDIDLRALDANVKLAGDQAFAFSGQTARANAVWYVKLGSDLLLRADIDGNTSFDFEVHLKALGTLVARDLLL